MSCARPVPADRAVAAPRSLPIRRPPPAPLTTPPLAGATLPTPKPTGGATCLAVRTGRPVVAAAAVPGAEPTPPVVTTDLYLHALIAGAMPSPVVPRRGVRTAATGLAVTAEVAAVVGDAPTAPDVAAVQATTAQLGTGGEPLRAGGRRADTLVGASALLPEERVGKVPAVPRTAAADAAGGLGAAASVAAPIGDPAEGRAGAVVAGRPLVRATGPDRPPPKIGVVAEPLVRGARPVLRLVGVAEAELFRPAPHTRAVLVAVGVDPLAVGRPRQAGPVLDGAPLPARARATQPYGRHVPPPGPRLGRTGGVVS